MPCWEFITFHPFAPRWDDYAVYTTRRWAPFSRRNSCYQQLHSRFYRCRYDYADYCRREPWRLARHWAPQQPIYGLAVLLTPLHLPRHFGSAGIAFVAIRWELNSRRHAGRKYMRAIALLQGRIRAPFDCLSGICAYASISRRLIRRRQYYRRGYD